jgi:hypothetical protein
MRKRGPAAASGLIVLLAIGSIFGGRPSRAASCETEMQECSRLQDTLSVRHEVLKKNRDYLTKNPDASASAKIKVRSNIAMAEIQIETITNQISLLSVEMKKKGCAECKL